MADCQKRDRPFDRRSCQVNLPDMQAQGTGQTVAVVPGVAGFGLVLKGGDMFTFIKKLLGKKVESPITTNWIPKLLKPKEKFNDAGMSVRVQKRSAKNKRRNKISRISRRINRRRAA